MTHILVLLGMIIAAIFAVNANIIRRSIIYLEVLSLLAVFSYTYMNAPDVALAEIVIGCLFSTILLLIALREKKIFRIGYFRTENTGTLEIEKHFYEFAKEHELQLDIVERLNDLSIVRDRRECDIILRVTDNEYHIYFTFRVFKQKELREWVESNKMENTIIHVENKEMKI